MSLTTLEEARSLNLGSRYLAIVGRVGEKIFWNYEFFLVEVDLLEWFEGEFEFLFLIETVFVIFFVFMLEVEKSGLEELGYFELRECFL